MDVAKFVNYRFIYHEFNCHLTTKQFVICYLRCIKRKIVLLGKRNLPALQVVTTLPLKFYFVFNSSKYKLGFHQSISKSECD